MSKHQKEPVRNAKRQKTSEDSNTGLMAQLECPICFVKPMMPPIRQCSNGHVLCDSCSRTPQCASCPQCRSHPTNIRCLALEKSVEGLEFECEHAKLGCDAVVPYNELANHLSTCRFRPFKCMYCNETLEMDHLKIVQHFVGKHDIQVVEQIAPKKATNALRDVQVKFKVHDLVNTNEWQDKIIKMHDGSASFLVRARCQDDHYRFIVLYCGVGVDIHNPYDSTITFEGGRYKMCIQMPALSVSKARCSDVFSHAVRRKVADVAMKSKGLEGDFVINVNIWLRE